MFEIDSDKTIYITRGDVAFFTVTAESNGVPYRFQVGDIVRMKVTAKKDCTNVAFQKDFPVLQETEVVDILLTEEETKIGDVISKPVDYWYEIELNPYTTPQTIVGYDEDGAKIFKLFPEGRDLGAEPVSEEDVEVVDDELSMTSTKPIQNRAVTVALAKLSSEVKNIEVGGAVGNVPVIEMIADSEWEFIMPQTDGCYLLLNEFNHALTFCGNGYTFIPTSGLIVVSTFDSTKTRIDFFSNNTKVVIENADESVEHFEIISITETNEAVEALEEELDGHKTDDNAHADIRGEIDSVRTSVEEVGSEVESLREELESAGNSTVEIDETLSIPGKAADAKSVGDVITEIVESDIESVRQQSNQNMTDISELQQSLTQHNNSNNVAINGLHDKIDNHKEDPAAHADIIAPLRGGTVISLAPGASVAINEVVYGLGVYVINNPYKAGSITSADMGHDFSPSSGLMIITDATPTGATGQKTVWFMQDDETWTLDSEWC